MTLFGEVSAEPVGRVRGDLRLGHHTAVSPIVNVGPEGIVGADILHRFELAIDQRSMAVRFGATRPVTMTWPP